jgi:hypothetical protein
VATLLPRHPKLLLLDSQSVATVELLIRRDAGVHTVSANQTCQVGMIETANCALGQVTVEVLSVLFAVTNGPVT